jgi:hypothetical protein
MILAELKWDFKKKAHRAAVGTHGNAVGFPAMQSD